MPEEIILEPDRSLPWCKSQEAERQRKKTKPVPLELRKKAGTVQGSRGRALAV